MFKILPAYFPLLSIVDDLVQPNCGQAVEIGIFLFHGDSFKCLLKLRTGAVYLPRL